MRIEGATALITGGSSGLGAAAARMIVDCGGRVVVADLKPGAEARTLEPSALKATTVYRPSEPLFAMRTCPVAWLVTVISAFVISAWL